MMADTLPASNERWGSKDLRISVLVGMAFAVLVGLFSILYWLDSADRLPISTTTDANWSEGVYRHGAPGILVEYSPYAEAIKPGSQVIFDNGEARRVAKIVGAAGPYWEIWLEGGPFTGPMPKIIAASDGPSPLLLFLVGFFIALLLMTVIAAAAFMFLTDKGLFAPSPGLLAYGASYFVGMAFLLLSWRAIDALSGNATLGLCATILIVLTYMGVHLRQDKFRRSELLKVLNHSLLLALLSFGLLVYFLFFWVAPHPGALDFTNAGLPLGPFESGRYANIASLIWQTDHIPVLRQNYGQSILSAAPGLFGLNIPRLSLIVFLAISVAALVMLTAGFVAQLGFNRKAQVFITLVILLASPRLTFITVLLTDNHSTPILYNAYADTILGIGGLFVGFLCLALPDGKTWAKLVSLFLLATLWSLCGLQSAAVFLFFCAAMVILGLKRSDRRWRLNIGAALVVIGGLIATLPLGGVFTPEKYQSDVSFRGHYPAPVMQEADIDLQFRSHYLLLPDPHRWKYAGAGYTVWIHKLSWNSVEVAYKNIFNIETAIIDLMRSLFFILCGLLFYLYRRPPDGADSSLERVLMRWTVCSLLVGLFFAYFLLLNKVSKELSRFMNPAYFFGMMLFGLGLWRGLETQRSFGVKAMSIVLMVLAIAGPIAGILLQILGAYANLSIAQKVNILLSVPQMATG